ncbi:MAG: NAD-dependent epimerase/dehydratase family protein [Acidimicrobiales bacterium]|nr:NAD-dependent epimerase/dehydratase family protein [Acidimicrobiales bacterium]
MRAIVTGCAGFIGSHLTERLIADGWRVTGIDAFTPYYDPADKEANLAGLRSEPGFDLVRADLVTAPLEQLFADRPAVFHLAAQPGVRASFGDGFAQYLHDNVRATQRLFESASDAGCARVVYASSSSVYGDAEAYPCVEDRTPTAPRSPYGVTKRTCEDLARIARSAGLETVGLRYFTVYGPRQRPDMAMRRLCEAVLGGPTFRLHGDGSQSRDFTYVADAVDATIAAMTAPTPHPVLNVGGGQEASMTEVIATIEGLAGRPIPLERTDAQRGDVVRTGADTERARSELGWTPRVQLADGLRAELDWAATRRAQSLLSAPVLAGALA